MPAPPTTESSPCVDQHIVSAGENLFRIAFNCGLTTEQLATANNIPYPHIIYPGQVLSFP
jgi:LysM repeat protein